MFRQLEEDFGMVRSIHRKKLNLNRKAHSISNTEFYELDVFPLILK